jgi:2-polyprenyl-3-methyl-5-hydroxy-6-metoxy-1,4-benzoquinol methylase
MRSLKSAAVDRGWLKPDERLLIPRLAYPLAQDLPDVVHENNRAARDTVVFEALDGIATPIANPSLFAPEPEITIAEVDRYGIPLRTVLGTRSGLMRSDPYYAEDYLARFYSQHYRNLYRPVRFSLAWLLSEQIRAGQRILERHQHQLPPKARILDVGCAMGGMLIPFRLAGHEVAGCDYGPDYIAHGTKLGLDLRPGGPEVFEDTDPFDLILLSHVLEHTTHPISFLTQISSLLKPDGLCHIEVPGLLNLDQYYKGDILIFLQNAHRWHFTAATLEAIVRRSGLSVLQTDQSIVCIATPADKDQNATPTDGQTVLTELNRLESAQKSTQALN